MTRRVFGWLLQFGLACAAASCSSQESLLGEDCGDAGASCGGNAPTFRVDTAGPGQQFDVIAEQSIAPNWLRELPCEGTCGGMIQPGPDGGIWAVIRDSQGLTLSLVRDEIELVVQQQPEWGGGVLSVDSDLNARFVSWSGDGSSPRVAHITSDGAESEQTLPAPGESNTHGPTGYDVSAGGDLSIWHFQRGGGHVTQYDSQGRQRWRQTDLRVAKRFPFEPGAPNFDRSLLSLSDGSLALALPKYIGEDRDEGGSGRYQGVTVLDHEGKLRWDAAITPLDPATVVNSLLMAAGSNGALVIAVAFQDVLLVSAFDQTPSLVASWTGNRTGFFDPRPSGLCVDPQGSIYVAVRTGESDAPRRTLCKLRSDAPSTPADCRDLELPAEYTPATESDRTDWSSDLSIACSAPDTVVALIAGKRADQTLLVKVAF